MYNVQKVTPSSFAHAELSLITLHWFLTSFASVVDIRLLLRIWDLLFYQGSLVLFQITLGMLKIKVFVPHCVFQTSLIQFNFNVLKCCFNLISFFCLFHFHFIYFSCMKDDGLSLPYSRKTAYLSLWNLLLTPQEEELVTSENSASIFNTLSDLPSQLRDGPAVLGEAMRLAGTLSQETLEAHRHKHLAYILNEQAQLNNGNNTALNTNLNKVSFYQNVKELVRVTVILFFKLKAVIE